MVTYIYFVKCPNCEDEHFDFFDEAKEFALGCLSQKPIITQTEVCRNDFGECTDSADLGTVWSWEDIMGESEGGYTEAEPTKSIFTKDDLKLMADGQDPEFDSLDNSVDCKAEEPILDEWVTTPGQETAKQYVIKVSNDSDGYNYEGNGGRSLVRIDSDALSIFSSLADAEASLAGYKKGSKAKIVELADELRRKPIPEGMTIEQLVEEMEENEDTVECAWCNDLFDKSECRYEVGAGGPDDGLGWLCSRCEMAIKSRGETLTFRENNYWDFLDEDIDNAKSLADLVKDSINHLVNDIGYDSSAEDFVDDVIADIENNYDIEVPEDPEKYRGWASAIACEISRQLNNQPQLDEELETKTWICEFDGKEIGTVEAVTEEEAYEAMEHKYYDYNYGLYDGVAMVYPADEDLTEASLSDIAAAANSEFGSSWDDDYLLDVAGVDDDFRSIDSFGDTLSKVRKARELSPEKIAEREAKAAEHERQKNMRFAQRYVAKYGAERYNTQYPVGRQNWRQEWPYYDEATGEFVEGERRDELVKKFEDEQHAKRMAEYEERHNQPRWYIQTRYNGKWHNLMNTTATTKEAAESWALDYMKNLEAERRAAGGRFDWKETDIRVVAGKGPGPGALQRFEEDFDPEELHDLGNEYDDGYPNETSEVSDSHLRLCPECGKETFDIETGICVDCGFN